MPSEDTQFKPGQSGNPKGGSKKRSRQRLLRECLPAFCAGKIPEDIRDELPEALKELNGYDAIAHRLLTIALTGKENLALSAIHEIISTEPKQVQMQVEETDADPYVAPDDEFRGKLEEYFRKAPELIQ